MQGRYSEYHLSLVIMLGSVWGLSEAALGISLKQAFRYILSPATLILCATTMVLIRLV